MQGLPHSFSYARTVGLTFGADRANAPRKNIKLDKATPPQTDAMDIDSQDNDQFVLTHPESDEPILDQHMRYNNYQKDHPNTQSPLYILALAHFRRDANQPALLVNRKLNTPQGKLAKENLQPAEISNILKKAQEQAQLEFASQQMEASQSFQKMLIERGIQPKAPFHGQKRSREE